jgi:hypothetical protein
MRLDYETRSTVAGRLVFDLFTHHPSSQRTGRHLPASNGRFRSAADLGACSRLMIRPTMHRSRHFPMSSARRGRSSPECARITPRIGNFGLFWHFCFRNRVVLYAHEAVRRVAWANPCAFLRRPSHRLKSPNFAFAFYLTVRDPKTKACLECCDAPRRAGGRSACVFRCAHYSIARRFRLTSGAARAMAQRPPLQA